MIIRHILSLSQVIDKNSGMNIGLRAKRLKVSRKAFEYK